MKRKLLFVFTLTCFTVAVQAQIGKGSVLLGGDVGFSTQKTKPIESVPDTRKLNGFYISPTVGVAVRNNLVVGGSLSFRTQSEKREANDYSSKLTGYGAGVFVRKYKPIGSSGFYVFGQAGLQFAYLDQELKSNGSPILQKSKITNISINVYPGISYAVSKRFHLESGFNNLLSLGYTREKSLLESPGAVSGYTSNGFSLSSSLSNAQSAFYVGFRVLLAK